jgi:flagellar biosynthetic protein FliR
VSSSLPAILERIPPALLVIFRLGGLMTSAPLLSSAALPVRVRIFLAFLLGLAVFPTVEDRCALPGGAGPDLWWIAPAVARELLVGMVIGFAALLPLVAMQIGGHVMGQQMGLGLARVFNPELDDEADVLEQVFFLVALAGFVLVDGHEALLLAVLRSFDHVPPGGFIPDAGLAGFLGGLLRACLELGLRVSAPLLCLIFLETAAMGFVARTVPQLNILSLGFPLRILAGLLVIATGLTIIREVLMDGVDETLAAIFGFLETL